MPSSRWMCIDTTYLWWSLALFDCRHTWSSFKTPAFETYWTPHCPIGVYRIHGYCYQSILRYPYALECLGIWLILCPRRCVMCAGLFPNVAQVQRQSNARGTSPGKRSCCCHVLRNVAFLTDTELGWVMAGCLSCFQCFEVPYFCEPAARTLCTSSFESEFSPGKCLHLSALSDHSISSASALPSWGVCCQSWLATLPWQGKDNSGLPPRHNIGRQAFGMAQCNHITLNSSIFRVAAFWRSTDWLWLVGFFPLFPARKNLSLFFGADFRQAPCQFCCLAVN